LNLAGLVAGRRRYSVLDRVEYQNEVEEELYGARRANGCGQFASLNKPVMNKDVISSSYA